MTIDIDIETFSILITQRWRLVKSGGYSSISVESFKRNVASRIQSIWNEKCSVRLIEKDTPKRKGMKTTFSLDFRVRWVTSNEHWKVYIQPPGRSRVRWSTREVFLDIYDTTSQSAMQAPEGLTQYPVAHEFGHTIGNSRNAFPSLSMGGRNVSIITHGDEYPVSSQVAHHRRINQQRKEFIADISSIMNMGNSLRRRHFDYILQELNSMCSPFYGAYFEIADVD